jgi:hypothetical protein
MWKQHGKTYAIAPDTAACVSSQRHSTQAGPKPCKNSFHFDEPLHNYTLLVRGPRKTVHHAPLSSGKIVSAEPTHREDDAGDRVV